jgi:hypothetical protein
MKNFAVFCVFVTHTLSAALCGVSTCPFNPATGNSLHQHTLLSNPLPHFEPGHRPNYNLPCLLLHLQLKNSTVCRTEELRRVYGACISRHVRTSSSPTATVIVFTSEATHVTNKSYIHIAVPSLVSFPEIAVRCNHFLVEVFRFGVPHLLVLIYSSKTEKQQTTINFHKCRWIYLI